MISLKNFESLLMGENSFKVLCGKYSMKGIKFKKITKVNVFGVIKSKPPKPKINPTKTGLRV